MDSSSYGREIWTQHHTAGWCRAWTRTRLHAFLPNTCSLAHLISSTDSSPWCSPKPGFQKEGRAWGEKRGMFLTKGKAKLKSKIFKENSNNVNNNMNNMVRLHFPTFLRYNFWPDSLAEPGDPAEERSFQVLARLSCQGKRLEKEDKEKKKRKGRYALVTRDLSSSTYNQRFIIL